ncbi:TetR family transcriptional regulator [bacterium]|nr:MAG: TetR family transcriptional regulator [bacterium]
MTAATAPARLTDRKHAAILEAAIEEFRAAGFEATSMDRVAARAGVSKRTVYNHFPSKEALFLRILETMFERGDAGPDLAYRADKPLRPQLLELVRQKLKLLHDADFIDLARIAIAAGIQRPDLAREMLARLGDREEGLTTWVRAATADRRLKTDDPQFAALQLQGLLKSLAFWPQLSMGQPPLSAAKQKHVADSSVDMFLARYA